MLGVFVVIESQLENLAEELAPSRETNILMEKIVSISLGVVLMPMKNGDFGVEHLPVIPVLAFVSERRQ